MKNLKRILSVLSIAAVAAAGLACSGGDEPYKAFAAAEYTVDNGYSVSQGDNRVTYKILGEGATGVALSDGGTFTVTGEASDGVQVVVAAVADGKVISTAVCKVQVPIAPPQVEFDGLSDYIIDGGRVHAYSGYGVSYSLKAPVDGVKINSSSGRVSFTEIVEDGTPFTVVASSRGGTAEREYLAAVGALITVDNASELAEAGVGRDVSFTLNYGDMSGSGAVFAEQGVLGVSVAGARLSEGTQYTYDKDTYTVTIDKAVTQALTVGENEVQIYTAKNAATAQINAATYVRTAQDLAAINTSQKTLAGYYALVNDIDLTDYLAIPAKSAQDGEAAEKNPGGWQPIGQYREVTDGSATAMAFRGTFDGLGHKISGLWIDWTEDREPMWEDDGVTPVWQKNANGEYVLDAEGNKVQQKAPKPQYFNGGLFGYTTSDSVIRNLEVEGAEGKKAYMCSYSGGLVGFNSGLVENCKTNVNVALEADHRVAGGLVGRNVGTVRNCISLGTVLAGSSYGALCGINEGDVINCFATDTLDFSSLDEAAQKDYAGRPDTLSLCGAHGGNGKTTGNTVVYKTLDALIAGADFAVLGDGWSVMAGEIPALVVKEGK